MTDAEIRAVTRELERLRPDLAAIAHDVGEVKTLCAVLVERSTRTEQDVRDLRAETDEAIGKLRGELEALKSRRWPLQTVTALVGLLGVLVAVVALFVQ